MKTTRTTTEMSDRELLELAARAAGFSDAEWAVKQACIYTAQLPGFRCFWNPLADDGDSLRLAVKLGIEISFVNNLGIAEVWALHHIEYCSEEIKSDPYVATRR